MRHLVPFVGEQRITRADDEQARAKRIGGRIIDDVVGNGKAESSWDDVVPKTWIDKTKPKPIISPAANAIPKAQVPLTPQPRVMAARPANTARANSIASPKPISASASITFSDSASMDWVPINNGRGLRISVYGNIDNDLRKEWSRLLNDTESAAIKEFEFNLNDTPALSLTGLGMLLLFKERKGSLCDVIKLCNCNNEVARLLYWTGMDKYFVIETTQISASH